MSGASVASAVAVGSGVAALGAVIGVGAIARRPTARTVRRVGESAYAPSSRLTAMRRRRRAAAAIVAAATLAALAGPLMAVVAVASIPTLRHLGRRRRSAARHRAIESNLPDAIEVVVMCMHAGLTPARAIDVVPDLVAPSVRPGFAAVGLQLRRGRRLGDALGELTTILGPSARTFVTALAAADRDGLPLAPVLDRLVGEARAERRRQGEAAARRLPVRLSFPLVVCTLPSFVLLSIAPAVLGALSTLRGSAP